ITPVLSIITNIGLDHTQFLGDTRAAIAFEKAGILKAGVPVLIGEQDSETQPVFSEQIEQKKAIAAPLIDPPVYPENLFGYQRKNFKLVYSAIEVLREQRTISDQHIQDGIAHLYPNTGFMGRLQQLSSEPRIILDCAHNAHGIRACLASILPVSGQLHIIYGTSSDKNMQEIAELFPEDATYYFTTFTNPRSARLEQLQENFGVIGKNRIFFENPTEALRAAQLAANKADTILVFGSFFLVHDFFEDFFKFPLAEKK
ncbi:MAG: bifunctional folylpolyglutamate synthase/dihydrofolate synthase, partial [Fluviicola sp.]